MSLPRSLPEHMTSTVTEEQLQEAERRNAAGESWQEIADSLEVGPGRAISKSALINLVRGRHGPRRAQYEAQLEAQGDLRPERIETAEEPEPPPAPEKNQEVEPGFPAWLYPDVPSGLTPVWAVPVEVTPKDGFLLARFACPQCGREPAALDRLQMRVPAEYRGLCRPGALLRESGRPGARWSPRSR